MRRFGGGRGASALLVAPVFTAAAVFLAGVGLGEWNVGPSVAVAAAALLSVWGAVVRIRRRGDRHRDRSEVRDPLTNLHRRALFVDRAERALGEVAGGRQVAVMFVNLDDFEEINHSYGYEAGDGLLAAAAGRLESALRPTDTVARLGGDEFAVLLGEASGSAAADAAAERIAEALGAPFGLEGGEVLVSASVGIALSDGVRGTPESLLREANVAMHEAKKKGKARHRVFDPGAQSTTGGRLVQEAEMRRAIKEGEFRVYYQPLVSLETGDVAGVEALVRWQHPLYGLIPPAEFVPLAEQTGLIVRLGGWVLREACRQVCAWKREHRACRALTLSVNVSARQFQQPNLVREVGGILEETGLSPHDLKLEVTESVVIRDASAATALREMKALGIGIALDDFGTGYSSLSYLKRFPVDTLKIDRSYVEGLGSDAGDTAIVHATVAFAKALNLNVTAEGIESPGQLALLKDLGCELGQGYHFARPLPSDEAGRLVARGLRRQPRATGVPGERLNQP